MDVDEASEQQEDINMEEMGEYICAICDDGGNLLCCDGPCLRAFHATKWAASQSSSRCPSLGLDDSEVEVCSQVADSRYSKCIFSFSLHDRSTCKNSSVRIADTNNINALNVESLAGLKCQTKKLDLKLIVLRCKKLMRCYMQVFLCDVALCGHFYHVSCVSKLLGVAVTEGGFICPLHKCFKCGQREEASRLYPCRRCPRAWHKKCTDERIKFNDESETDVRGWILGQARFLYCLRHKLVSDLCTPAREHLLFPKGPNSVAANRCTTIDDQLKDKPKRKTLPFPDVGSKRTAFSSVLPGEKLPTFKAEEVEGVVLSLIKKSKRRILREEVAAKLALPSTVGATANKHVQLGKLESLLQAFKKASECLARGGTREEIQCILPFQLLQHFEKARESLKVYLAPALYGMRYSSFGRHFTQIIKLQEIADMLHWYIDAGDTVVDFCCGRNDFSRLISSKLAETNKHCYYKNFDIIQPDDTFNFEQRDFMTVQRHELPHGDKLVMGLNPPFGVNGQTASRFVQHAASFFPKIIILIAPDRTRGPANGYELVWKDDKRLQGEAFYLPGSIDVNGKAISQENNNPPMLFLWSRKDWAREHLRIAREIPR